MGSFFEGISFGPNSTVPKSHGRPRRGVMISILRLLRAAAGSDRDLLDRYARDRDEAAFEALVRRYGAGVWAACARLAGPDAEDVFQAVFFILSRKAGTVTGSLPAWLHAVTRRVASTLRRDSRRRKAIETAAARPDLTNGPDPTICEGLARLDEELSRLPERYRAVLIVCCLEGRSRDEAAAQLGWSEGQVKGRLERARELLRARLARRGVELGGLLLVAAVAGSVPVRAAPPSAAAVTLTSGVIRAMLIQKFGQAVAVLAACVGVALAGGVVLRAQPGGPPPAAPNGVATVPEGPPENRVGVGEPQDKANPPSTNRAEVMGEKVKNLQKERVATLKEVVDTSLRLARVARLEVGEAMEDRMALLKAELEVAEKESDRVALYKQTLDALTEYEKLARAQKEAARGTESTVLRVKARRLEVEICLEQAKAKEAKERK
jgi:RNA polymerase sigma factor (sigma-70 family)